MGQVNQYNHGTFCWADLATTDAESAKKFYTQLLDWSFVDIPAGPNVYYTMLQLAGKDVSALYQMNDNQLSQGILPHWQSFISVSDTDVIAERVPALGGKVIMSPADIFDAGRMAVLQDPTNAMFSIWQPKKHIGARILNEPGALCWNELTTGNEKKARGFYINLFGWNVKTHDMGIPHYTEFYLYGKPVGSMLQMTEEWIDILPQWMVYFAVADCDDSVDKAKTLGADIKVPPTTIPNVGRFAVIEDLQGAVFSIMKLDSSTPV